MNWFQRTFRKAASSLAKFLFAPTWVRYAFSKISLSKLINEGYKQNSAVSACATTLQLTFPEPPLLAGTEEESRFIPNYNHPIMQLLKHPNPDMGMAEFLQFVIAYNSIGGNAYIWKQRAVNRKVIALWPFSDVHISPIAGHDTNEGFVGYYEYNAGDGKKIQISKEDIIHWKWMVDPQNPWKGIGPIELSAREVDRDNEASSYIYSLLKNNAVPPVVITLEENDDSTQEELDMMSLKWTQKHGSGQPAFITAGMKVEQMGYDLNKLAAETLADVPETRIAANFHVPPSVAGLNVGVKRSDYGDTAARKAFTEQTLMALWRSLASELLNGLKDEYPNTPENFIIWFDTRNVGALQELEKDKRTSVNELWKSGLFTRAEAKQQLGMKPTQGDEVYFISLASEFVPAGEEVIRQPLISEVATNTGMQSSMNDNQSEMSTSMDTNNQLSAEDWLGIAIRRHERHMAGKEPTSGPDGEISQKLMMEEMNYARIALTGEKVVPTKWYNDNIAKFPDQDESMAKDQSAGGRRKKSRAGGQILQRIRLDVARRMKQSVNAYFSQLSDRVVERAGKSYMPGKADLPDAGSLITGDDRKKLEMLIKRFYIEIIQLSWETWNYTLGVTTAFDLTDPIVTEVLQSAARSVREITSTTLDEIRGALIYANENGWSVDQLVRGDENQPGLRDIVDETYQGRAENIARTELGEAQNQATVSRYEAAGVSLVEILDNGSTDDDEACQVANGQIWTLAYFSENVLEHPNCTRAAAPYFGDAKPDRG